MTPAANAPQTRKDGPPSLNSATGVSGQREAVLKTPWQRRVLGLIPTHPAVQLMATAAELYAAGMLSGDARHRLVIIGGPGNGKTTILERLWHWHRTVPIARWPRENRDGETDGFSCQMHDWPELCHRAMKDEDDWRWSEARQCGLLLLDDVGSEADKYKSGEPTTLLGGLLGVRKNRWTVITTNVPVANWRKVWDQRVADRLFRDSRIVDLEDCPSFAFTEPPKTKAPAEEKKLATDEQLKTWAKQLAELRARITA